MIRLHLQDGPAHVAGGQSLQGQIAMACRDGDPLLGGVCAPRLLGPALAATILLSAFLLFQIQPLVSKAILPWFGGSPAVWTTCMLFFQTLLFGGYVYAHLSEHVLGRRTRLIVHLLVIAAALAALPILPSDAWKPEPSSNPTWRILGLLLVCVGAPYFVLSSTGPLVQSWFSRIFPDRSPYRLYALSNVGSLGALLSYPFVFEPQWDVATQATFWSWGFAGFAALSAIGAIRVRRAPAPADAAQELAGDAPRPVWRQRLAWLVLPALGSVILLATTNHACQDIAVVPFLWVVPLSLYLLSFIICFDHERWYRRLPYAAATFALVLLSCSIGELQTWFDFRLELALYFTTMFGVCMLCHGELVRLRPAPRHLTGFYLTIAAGGALGGLAVGLAAPQLCSTHLEWPLSLIAGVVLAAGLVVVHVRRRWLIAVPAGLLAIAGLSAALYWECSGGRERLLQSRNFYGTVSVVERATDYPLDHDIALYSGRILHGVQFVDSEKRGYPTTYYSDRSGVGMALTYLQHRGALRVGVVGLGAGTLAAYANAGDTYRFYEINPEMVRVAREYFTYLADSRGDVEVVLGDARLSLERESDQQYDVLAVDAFSGDSIPTHLLTREAMQLYQRHLKPHGMLCLHVTNRYLDVPAVAAGLAEDAGLPWRLIASGEDEEGDGEVYSADWVLVSRDEALLDQVAQDAGDETPVRRRVVWTDAYSNLFTILGIE